MASNPFDVSPNPFDAGTNQDEGWIIPPRTEKDAQGFTLPMDQRAEPKINEEELKQAQEVGVIPALAKTTGAFSKEVAHVVGAGPEVAASTLLVPGWKAVAGLYGLGRIVKELSEGRPFEDIILDDTLIKTMHDLEYKPKSKYTELVFEGVGTAFETSATALASHLAYGPDYVPELDRKNWSKEEAQTRDALFESLKVSLFAAGDLSMAKAGIGQVKQLEKAGQDFRTYQKDVTKDEQFAQEGMSGEWKPFGEDTTLTQGHFHFEYDFTTPIKDKNGEVTGQIKGTYNDHTRVATIDMAEHKGDAAEKTTALSSIIDSASRNNITVKSSDHISTADIAAAMHVARTNKDVTVIRSKNIAYDIKNDGTFFTADGRPAFEIIPKITAEGLAPHISRSWDQAIVENVAYDLQRKLRAIFPKITDNKYIETRAVDELVPALVKKTELVEGDKKTNVFTATERDLPDRYADPNKRYKVGAGSWIPTSFIGWIRDNSIARYTSSMIGREETMITMEINRLLYGSDVKWSMGRPVLEPSKAGLLVQGRHLNDKQKEVFLDMLQNIQRYTDPVRAKELKEQGLYDLTKTELEAYVSQFKLPREEALQVVGLYTSVREAIQSKVNALEGTSKRLNEAGRPGIFFNKVLGYFPLKWDGDFITFAKVNGETVHALTSRTKLGTLESESKLKQQYPEAEISSEKRRISSNELNYETLYQLIQQASEEGNTKVVKFLRENLPQFGVMLHSKDRNFVQGFNWDRNTHGLEAAWEGYEKTLNKFLQEAMKAESGMRMNYALDVLGQGPISKLYPNAMDWSRATLADYMGKQVALDKIVDNIVGDYIGPSAVSKATNIGGKWVTRTKILFMHPIHLMMQATQYSKIMSKIDGLAQEYGVDVKNVQTVPVTSLQKLISKDPEYMELMNEATKQGAISTTFAQFMYEYEHSFEGPQRTVKTIRDLDKRVYSYFDEMQRMTAVAGLYEFFRHHAKQDAITARTNAIELGNHYSVKYSGSETPAAYRGTTGAVIGHFQKWAANDAAQLIEALTKAHKNGNSAQAVALMASGIAISGVQGLWGVQDADKAITTLNSNIGTDYRTPSEYLASETPDALLPIVYGPVQWKTNTYATQTSLPGVSRSILNPIIVSTAIEIATAWGKLTVGSPNTNLDYERAVLSITPSPMLAELVKRSFEDDSQEGDESWMAHSPKTGAAQVLVTKDTQWKRLLGTKDLYEWRVEKIAEWAHSISKSGDMQVQDLVHWMAAVITMDNGRNIEKTEQLLSNITEKYGLDQGEIQKKLRKELEKMNIAYEDRIKKNEHEKRRTKGESVRKITDITEEPKVLSNPFDVKSEADNPFNTTNE